MTKFKHRQNSEKYLYLVLHNIKDNDIICYILSNFYFNFSEYNSIPSIYDSLKWLMKILYEI